VGIQLRLRGGVAVALAAVWSLRRLYKRRRSLQQLSLQRESDSVYDVTVRNGLHLSADNDLRAHHQTTGSDSELRHKSKILRELCVVL